MPIEFLSFLEKSMSRIYSLPENSKNDTYVIFIDPENLNEEQVVYISESREKWEEVLKHPDSNNPNIHFGINLASTESQ